MREGGREGHGFNHISAFHCRFLKNMIKLTWQPVLLFIVAIVTWNSWNA